MNHSLRKLTALSTAMIFALHPLIVIAQSTPPAIPVQMMTQQDIYDTWELFYETMFTSTYDVNATKLNLDSTVVGPGQYGGTNQNAEDFELNVLSAVQLDVTDLDLPPATVTQMLRQNVTWAIVEAVATSDTGTLGISGMAISRHNATIPFESVFIPLSVIPTFYGMTAEPPSPLEICIPIPIFCPDPDCLADCLDDYADKVDAAVDAANLATANENVTHNTNMTQLANTLAGANDLADTNYHTQMKTCAKIAVAGTAISIAAAFITLGAGAGGLIVTATALAACQLNASNTRDIAKNTAQSVYDTGAANENARHEGELQEIANNLQSQLDEAQEELEDCQDDCPLVICGWRMICIISIPFPF
jgi:hypothetical protein